MTARPFVVAIDGPAASGKGTLARRLAEHFGFAHLDTGALYRATAFLVLEQRGDPADPLTAARAAGLVHSGLLSDPRLRGEAVSAAASIVAAIPGVRGALLDLQRNFAAHPPKPAHGRDYRRPRYRIACLSSGRGKALRHGQCRGARPAPGRRVAATGAAAILEDVLQDLKERDARDSQRRAAPLIAAPDAAVIDTTSLDADTVFERVSNLIARALAAQR